MRQYASGLVGVQIKIRVGHSGNWRQVWGRKPKRAVPMRTSVAPS
jgi:hypothetical protein